MTSGFERSQENAFLFRALFERPHFREAHRAECRRALFSGRRNRSRRRRQDRAGCVPGPSAAGDGKALSIADCRLDGSNPNLSTFGKRDLGVRRFSSPWEESPVRAIPPAAIRT